MNIIFYIVIGFLSCAVFILFLISYYDEISNFNFNRYIKYDFIKIEHYIGYDFYDIRIHLQIIVDNEYVHYKKFYTLYGAKKFIKKLKTEDDFLNYLIKKNPYKKESLYIRSYER